MDDDTYIAILDRVSSELSNNQPSPFNWFVRAGIRNAAKPFATDSSRNGNLQRLIDFNLTDVGQTCFERVSSLLSAPISDLELHIVPAIDQFGGGCCIAPGKVLVAVKIDEFSPVRLQRNVAHEYSHSVRMTQKPQATEHGYGHEVRYTIRDYLIFEGLAMVLSDTLYPSPIQPHDVSDTEEEAWWNEVNIDAVGVKGYVDYIGLRAYEIGSRIVRAYLGNRDISVLQAHYLTDEELYWRSGYRDIK